MIKSTNMDCYRENKVIQVGEEPSFEEHFGDSTNTHPDFTMTSKRYLHLACSNNHYLLRPSFERVRIVDFLVEPLYVERVDVSSKPVLTSVRNLLLSHERKDGRSELRGVEVEGNYWAHRHDNVSHVDGDRDFVDEFLLRPLKRVSVGDVVLVVPAYWRFVVLGGSEDGLELSLVLERPEGAEGGWWAPSPVLVKIEEVRVVQEFKHRCGSTTNVLLMIDYRGVSP